MDKTVMMESRPRLPFNRPSSSDAMPAMELPVKFRQARPKPQVLRGTKSKSDAIRLVTNKLALKPKAMMATSASPSE